MKKYIFIMCLVAVIILLVIAANRTQLGFALRTLVSLELFPPSIVEVGDNMVDTKLFDIDGNKIYLSDYLSNKFLLLNFYSSGCEHCRRAWPELKEISEIYPDNLTIISVNIDLKASWEKARAEQQMPWVFVRDPKSHAGIAGKYGNDGRVPYWVIISPEGKVVAKWFNTDGPVKKRVSENVK